MGWVLDSPGAKVPSSRIEQPLRPLLSISLEPSFAREIPGGNFAPERRERVESPAGAAQPHALDARLTANGNQGGAAETFGVWLFQIVQKHASIRNYSVATIRFLRCCIRELNGKGERKIHIRWDAMKS